MGAGAAARRAARDSDSAEIARGGIQHPDVQWRKLRLKTKYESSLSYFGSNR